MITKKEFKVIRGDLSEVGDVLNEFNEKGIINIIAFNTDHAGTQTVLVHVGPFKHERPEKIIIDREIEVLDLVRPFKETMLYIVIEIRDSKSTVYNMAKDYKTIIENKYLTILSIDEAVELFNKIPKY